MDRLDICNKIYVPLVDFMPDQQAVDTLDELMKALDKYAEIYRRLSSRIAQIYER